MKSFHKLFSVFVIFFAAVTLFSLPVSAKTVQALSYALSYEGSEADAVPSGGVKNGVRVLDMNASWEILGDAVRVRRHMNRGTCTASAVLDTEECEGETVFTLSLDDDLSEYNMLCFGVGFSMTTGSYSLIRTDMELADASGNRVKSRTELPVSLREGAPDSSFCWYMVYFDISDFSGRGDCAQFTVKFSYHPAEIPQSLRISNPYAAVEDDGGFSYIDRYLTDSLTASGGGFNMSDGTASPGIGGRLELTGNVILAEQPETGSDAFLEIELSHFSSGSLTAGIGYDNGESIQSPRVYLNADGNTAAVYTVPFEVKGGIRTVKLIFEGMDYESYFLIDAIRLYTADNDGIAGTPELGRVSGIVRDGDRIRFYGEMERDAVNKYDDTILRFYAVPEWSDDAPETAIEIGQIKASNRFDYTADLSAYPNLADVCLFFAGIRTESGRILPLSAPSYPMAASIPEKTLSNIGLYDAASVGVFESNASHVIVDLPLDRLLVFSENGDSSVSLSYTVYETELPEDEEAQSPIVRSYTEKAALDHALLRTLDSEINFYISAGIEVYLRLTADSPVPGLTVSGNGADHYSLTADTPDARCFYTSLVHFLCRRYSGIAGFVMGYPVNVGQQTGDTGRKETAEHLRELADLCRITYNAASAEIPDVMLVIPFGEKSGDTETFRFIEIKTAAVMLASYFDEMGAVPWVMMYCTENLKGIFGKNILSENDLSEGTRLSDSYGKVQRTRQLLEELELNSNAAFMYYYEPSAETIQRRFRNTPDQTAWMQYLAEMFVKFCESTRAHAVFLSLDRLNGQLDHEFYSFLKKTEGTASGTGSYRRSVSDYLAVPSETAEELLSSMTAQTEVWDFTDKFYPLGWIAGGGVSSCLTVHSDLFSESGISGLDSARVLRSVITPDTDSDSQERKGFAAGIALRNLSRTVDFGEVDCLEFTFALTHPGMILGTGHEAGTVVFIIGSDDCRAEFAAKDAGYGQVQKFVCDLSDYEFRGQVDYMGILVYGDHEMYLDLASVNAYSSTLDQEELEAVFAGTPETEPVSDRAAIMLASGIVFIGSAVAAILLIRRDVEEDRERRRQLREEKHTRRERLRTRRY